MDRRTFIASAGTTALIAGLGPAAGLSQAFAGGAAADARLNALFDRIFAGTLDASPEFCTALGYDKGDRAAAKSRLDDNSDAGMRADLARTKAWLAELEAFPAAGLSEAGALNREIVTYSLRNQTVASERFGIDSVVRPYRIFQQGGAYFQQPDFLNDAHVIATKTDCDAYLARLDALAGVLDTDTAVQRERSARGITAPDFSIDLTLGQLGKLRNLPAEDNPLVRSLVRRAKEKGIEGDFSAPAAKVVEAKIYPALDRQIALMKQLRATTAPGSGVWRLRDGDAIYAAALAQATTTSLSPGEVHKMGLDQVAEISAELDSILKGQGLTQGGIGERLTALNRDPRQLYADSAEGRAALIASLNESVKAMYAKLPQDFAHVPTAPLEIRAVPVEIQDGASNGYYKRATLDGTRPAIYFINLKDVGDWPKYTLPSLTFHEGVPGHHLQISLAQESKDIPTLRKIGFFGAYSEGWALYAEQLADELKGYADPLERAGYLQSFLFRAARLVVDTGIHTKRWDRDKATAYMVDTTGFAQPRSQREVERYCTQPGQACSYKVGHMAWMRARANAQKALGSRFDIRQFHDVLKSGAMPLTVMERLVETRTKALLA
ncbi:MULTISPECIES: DUF885 domain-containing protein [unclassified Sphingomonas]|uniref:DUF885 domain-containing protein n=1 Tax=unclassified Sphingomonas TaxID=196159 RepID=UPI000701B31E|nr:MULTISPECIES: DUF885 family protein [unclassified Sphingomonas]KQX17992.1 Tat pathway signal protein [Sphingomonas sp. Root1294]KQY70917.1 Tat pathway signal protein [Sphingomonas sp. Root50]KRB91585.1 Tat pathway signal protein [Sphingomonas sp. Root720]